jgi:hypothetical protein
MPKGLRGTLAALALLSAGGLPIHFSYHAPPMPGAPENPANLIPLLFGVAGILAVPLLASSGRTWLAGYLINGFSAIVGILMMAYYDISTLQGIPGPDRLLLDSSLASILILLPKLIVGQRILLHYRPNGAGRMFTPAWWVRHFVYLSAVFAAGALLGRIGS